MTELTKWLQNTITGIETVVDDKSFVCDEIVFKIDVVKNVLTAFKVALASLEAEPVAVNDDMAYAFHHALSDSSLGSDEIEEIKTGLRAALANVSYTTTQDGWISCSERMPDKLIPVMVMYEDGEMWSAMWNGNRWDDGTEYPDPHSVTHWREMPAAPQQEVK